MLNTKKKIEHGKRNIEKNIPKTRHGGFRGKPATSSEPIRML